MKKIILLLLLAVSVTARTQSVRLESITDSTFGWMKVYNYKETPKPFQAGNRSYSSAQLKNCDLFVNWIQQSYLPKGWPGDAKRMVNEKPRASTRGERLNSQPLCYGAYAKFYTLLKKDAQGKIVPETGDAVYWNIVANELDVISLAVQCLSSAEQYYFTIPSYKKESKRDFSQYKTVGEREDFYKHPVLNKLIHYYLPKHHNNTDAGSYYVVLLTKDNQLPWTAITKAEYFQKAEENLHKWYKQEMEDNARKNKAYPKWLADGNTSINERMEKAKSTLARLKEKYKNRMLETAELAQWGNQANLWINEGNRDMFDTDGYTTFPVYKISKEKMQQCANGQPQWIAIYWSPSNNNAQENYLHTSILQNFNFQYVYDYFFGNEKITEPYKPVHTALNK